MKTISPPRRVKRTTPGKQSVKPVHKYRQGGSAAAASFPIVGIGASAGGLEAMTQLLTRLPSRTGMAFVLVQHLAPTHESALTTLLSRMTEMPVEEARNNLALLPNHLYVIPPNKWMGISGRKLKLFPRARAQLNLPIDEFLRTLAEEERNRAIGVILSGNGADGTHGLLAIKAAGGICFAQEEKTAKFPSMPKSAITTGCVDFVLPPEQIARELARIAGHPYIAPGGLVEDLEREPAAQDKTFNEILMLLCKRTGVDFSQYKHNTLRRRIQRRMVLHKTGTLKEYLDYLVRQPTEANELFSDLLIHVTGFFRDPQVFQALKRAKTMLSFSAAQSAVAAPALLVPGLLEVQKQADRLVLTNYSPPGVIINQHLDVLQFRGHTGPFLEHGQGEASLNLLEMARNGLALDVTQPA